MVKYSRTILGKIIAVSIVVFYSFIDPIYGALGCVVIILLYQTIFEFNQYTEGMDTYCNTDLNTNVPNKSIIEKNESIEKKSENSTKDWAYVANNLEMSNLGSFTKNESCLISNGDPSISINQNIKFEEGMVTYTSNTSEQHINTEDENKNKDRTEFENNHCDNGILRYKGSKVNLEMASLILPQLRYKGKTCNPCDKSCEYNIDNKLMLENEMMLPRDSNSWFQSVWERVWKSNKPDPVEYDGKASTTSEIFSK